MKSPHSKHGYLSRPCQFIEKVLEMMKNHKESVMWSKDGGLLRFTNLEEFETEILPNYFRHRNLLSFVRQLNMYYFSKCETSGPEEMLFKHQIFFQGNDKNFRKIVRRNRFRDDALTSMGSNLKDTLEVIKKDENLSQELKQLLQTGIEYKEIISKALMKLKAYSEELLERLKNSRGKQIKEANQEIQTRLIPELTNHLATLTKLESFTKNQLCRDLNLGHNSIVSNAVIEELEPLCNYHHKHYQSFDSLRRQSNRQFLENDEQDDEDGQISLQEDLQEENQKENQILEGNSNVLLYK